MNIENKSLCWWVYKLIWHDQHMKKSWKKLVTFAASPRAAVLEIRIAPKCFDTMYIICWVAQSSKNCQEFFCSFSVLCLLCKTELFTQWCSLQNISVLYIWLNMLNCSFEGCSVLLFRQPVVDHTYSPTKPAGGKLPTSTGHSILMK